MKGQGYCPPCYPKTDTCFSGWHPSNTIFIWEEIDYGNKLDILIQETLIDIRDKRYEQYHCSNCSSSVECKILYGVGLKNCCLKNGTIWIWCEEEA
jgi:hypothetical protein